MSTCCAARFDVFVCPKRFSPLDQAVLFIFGQFLYKKISNTMLGSMHRKSAFFVKAFNADDVTRQVVKALPSNNSKLIH